MFPEDHTFLRRTRAMRSHHTTGRGTSAVPASILTHSTILILGGFLIGMGAVDMAAAGIRNYVYLAGSFGVVAYIGLAHVARRRAQQALDREDERAAARMECRVSRHVAPAVRRDRQTRIHTRETSTSQHLPVVTRSRGPRVRSEMAGRR
jgi:hypothetical protein